MSRDELDAWLRVNIERLSHGSDDEKRVSVILAATGGALHSDSLPELAQQMAEWAEREIGRLTN